MIVSFCGEAYVDKETEARLKLKLIHAAEYFILEGARVFLSDGYSQYSKLCSNAIESLKEKYPYISHASVVEYVVPDFDGKVDSGYIKGLWGECEGDNQARKVRTYLVKKADAVISFEKRYNNFVGDAANLNFLKDKNMLRIKI